MVKSETMAHIENAYEQAALPSLTATVKIKAKAKPCEATSSSPFKKSAMGKIFGDIFVTRVEPAKSLLIDWRQRSAL